MDYEPENLGTRANRLKTPTHEIDRYHPTFCEGVGGNKMYERYGDTEYRVLSPCKVSLMMVSFNYKQKNLKVEGIFGNTD